MSSASDLEELLEHDPVVDVLAAGDRHRGDGGADAGVADDVVGARRLLDPGQLSWSQSIDPGDRLVHVPILVGVDGQADVGTDRLAGEGEPADVGVNVGSNLQLDLPEPGGDGFGSKADHLVVAVAEPAGAGGVSGIPVSEELLGAGVPSGHGVAEDGQCVGLAEGVVEVAEVDEVDELPWRQPGEQPPQRLAGTAGAEVPQSVEDRPRRHVDHALLRSQPAELRIVDEIATDGPEVTEHGVEVAPREPRGERLDRRALDLVAAPDREGEPMPGQSVDVGTDDQVRRRVVRVSVHRVRTVEHQRCGEAQVERLDGGDPRHRQRLARSAPVSVMCGDPPLQRPGIHPMSYGTQSGLSDDVKARPRKRPGSNRMTHRPAATTASGSQARTRLTCSPSPPARERTGPSSDYG